MLQMIEGAWHEDVVPQGKQFESELIAQECDHSRKEAVLGISSVSASQYY